MKRHHRETANLFQELIVDNFAGGGGASEGIAQALGCDVDIAINHDEAAITMHEANHPRTRHLCEDVFKVDPDKVCGGKRVRLAWFSPDCKHFSRAKGSKPVSKKIRGLAWVAVKWAKSKARPRIIVLENVREFEDWGPLTADNMPCPVRKGLTFKRFVSSLRNAGYEVEWKTLNAADFGAPTHRRRLFLIARCDGRAIVWPEPTHGPTDTRSNRHRKDMAEKSNVQPDEHRGHVRSNGERNAIDDRTLGADGLGNTANKKRGDARGSNRASSIGTGEHRHLQPYRTAAECIDFSLPCPSIFLTKEEAKAAGVKRPLAEKTMRRIAMGLKRYVLDNPNPFIVRVEHGGDHFRGQSIDKPLRTVSAKHGYGIVDPFVVGVGGRAGQTPATRGNAPVGTITAKNDRALVAPLLSKYHGQKGNESRCKSVDEPANTVDTSNRHGLVSAFLAKHYSGVVGHGTDRPLGTVTAVDHHSLVTANVVKFRGDSKGTPADAPLPTITSGDGAARPAGAAHAMGIAVSHLTQLRGSNRGNGGDIEKPMPAITAQGNHIGEVRAFMIKYFGQGVGATCDEPMHTVTSRDRFGLVTVEGVDYQIVDIGLRMLTPRELARAQGFPDSYILTGSKSSQVARIGNSVPPPVVAAIVRANCSDQREAVSA